ncbi:glycoside hydrolase family 172 protein [Aliifodinibius salipaludis]|uniref:glycoside hydrolase family 172 protein n=1 Tax=Fodinibius salipaludis TaxID=2032627 RepID=UPI0015955335|nr:glycoside hydrolase family 172 protein [Aliifodinibius salipaludis]
MSYSQSNVITLESLLEEMVDRKSLAVYPEPYYTTRQFSSYDRNSTQPGDSTWFANWDRTQFIRSEVNNGRKEYVMLETDKPGAIVRFWMTFAGEGSGEGTLRFYFDNEKEVTIEGTAFEVLSGGQLVGAPLSTSVSKKSDYEIRGHNLYLPLPYANHCKITYESENVKAVGAKDDEGESVYYNINYREYEKGTKVETFSKDKLRELENLVDEVQHQLNKSGENKLKKLVLSTKDYSTTLSPGDSHTLSLEGSSAIRKFTANLKAKNATQALRSTVLDVSFDGKRTIWVPIGDFFGTGYQFRKSETWYSSITKDNKLSVYWVMPFKDKATVTFKNFGNQDVTLKGVVSLSDWNWNDQSMHFGASWHQYTDLYTGEQKNMEGGGDPFDINYTRLDGEGVYVGDALTLFNTAYDWWGEGDEKIYIDGEDFPSHFGTGTEDYYGYAWVRPEKFADHPFISQPDGSGNITPGFTINKRYRSLDAIPFKQELIVDMEMWHWTKTKIDYAPTTFFYLKPDSKTLVQPDVENAKEKVSLKRSDIIPPRIKNGRLEAEHMVIEDMDGGKMRFQYLYEPNISNDKQLWWHEAQVGDKLVISFIADEKERYNAQAQFVTAPNYGRVKILFNGKEIVESFDASSEEISTRQLELGSLDLNEGKNQFEIAFEGISPNADQAFFGWDYIDFEKQK